MDNDHGLADYLLPGSGGGSNGNLQDRPGLSVQQDETDLVSAQLIHEMSNIRETQMQYGMPAIGDLFKARSIDVQETLNSVRYMLKLRIQDQDGKQDFRNKIQRADSQRADAENQLSRAKNKGEQLTREVSDLRVQLKTMETKHKSEVQKLMAERDDLLKQITKIEHKETQYRHEIKSGQMQLAKLQDTLKAKLFDKKATSNKGSEGGSVFQSTAKVIPSNDVKFSKMSAADEFSTIVQKSMEEQNQAAKAESAQLRDCLKLLQKEMFDIVKLKTDIYLKRFKAENITDAISSEEILKNDIEKIKEELFNLDFEEQGRDIIHRFRLNFQKLKEFMGNVDKGMAELQVFNQETADPVHDDDKGMTSVVQMKELFRNFEGIVESQHQLLQTSITKMNAIPPPDEIAANFEKFQILRDDELDDMRSFLNEHKEIMQTQHQDFEMEKKQFQEMNARMDLEKQKVAQERQKIEGEIKSIMVLNDDLYRIQGQQI